MDAGAELDPVDALRTITRIRLTEDVLTSAWAAGDVPGEYHSGIGEEGICAGVQAHLGPEDAVASDHRSTGPFVARGVDLAALMIEVLGGESGLNGGWAGHMHLMDPTIRTAADGIVGSSAPLAVGQALAAQRRRPGAVAVAFFGEGATNAGVVLEAMNLAATWRLPVLFVCKDNRWSITTRTSAVTAGDPRDRARAMQIPVRSVRGERVEAVHRAVADLVALARAGRGPGFLYATCHRPGGHFEGDPVLRPLADPRGQAAALAPGLIAGLRQPGGRRGDRAAGFATLVGRLAAAPRDRATGPRRDPLRNARRLVPTEVADRVHAEERSVVLDAARSAAKAIGRSTRAGSDA
jgi:TPP-dependent pyruvate/acetoin dehydrogenase alpha subunit